MEFITFKEEDNLQSIFNFYITAKQFPTKAMKKRLDRYDIQNISHEFKKANISSHDGVGYILILFALPIFLLIILLFLVLSGYDRYIIEPIGLGSLNFLSKVGIIFLIILFSLVLVLIILLFFSTRKGYSVSKLRPIIQKLNKKYKIKNAKFELVKTYDTLELKIINTGEGILLDEESESHQVMETVRSTRHLSTFNNFDSERELKVSLFIW